MKLAQYDKYEEQMLKLLSDRAEKGSVEAAAAVLKHIDDSKRSLALWQSLQDKKLPQQSQ